MACPRARTHPPRPSPSSPVTTEPWTPLTLLLGDIGGIYAVDECISYMLRKPHGAVARACEAAVDSAALYEGLGLIPPCLTVHFRHPAAPRKKQKGVALGVTNPPVGTGKPISGLSLYAFPRCAVFALSYCCGLAVVTARLNSRIPKRYPLPHGLSFPGRVPFPAASHARSSPGCFPLPSLASAASALPPSRFTDSLYIPTVPYATPLPRGRSPPGRVALFLNSLKSQSQSQSLNLSLSLYPSSPPRDTPPPKETQSHRQNDVKARKMPCSWRGCIGLDLAMDTLPPPHPRQSTRLAGEGGAGHPPTARPRHRTTPTHQSSRDVKDKMRATGLPHATVRGCQQPSRTPPRGGGALRLEE
ncbi:hypothetical protein B0H17DRAFT_1196099 [Mycena rosella]|uniref:Uncharacterized protein n=1 Tax=Mycena rosella TaxID=1033263 RepID=A0AAD7DUK7_MYCRO|nr:hypothetical protein B0H17DRAFT_1196099 [Mycena rosella]